MSNEGDERTHRSVLIAHRSVRYNADKRGEWRVAWVLLAGGAEYGGIGPMVYEVTLIPGDGIGPEVVEAARRVLEATGVEFRWHMADAGLDALEKTGDTLPEATVESVRRTKLGLKGPITTPIGTGFRSVNVGLRQALNLYANLRPARIFPGVRTRYDNVDIVVVRENTEDLYAGVEFDTGTEDAKKVIEAINPLTKRKLAPSSAI